MPCISNKMFYAEVKIDGNQYNIYTYIGGKYNEWGIPWVVWVYESSSFVRIYEEDIEEHTLEAAEAAHKRVIANIEQIVREHNVSC